MTEQEIIKMAKQAGGRFSRNPDKYDVMEITYCGLEAFAKMVAEKEREECAKICDERVTAYQYATDSWAQEHINEAKHLSQAIRERGKE